MTKEMGFLIALCATTAACYAFLARVDRIRAGRRFARRSSDSDSSGGEVLASSEGWSMAGWSSGGDSSACSTDNSGNFADSGSCGSGDSGGGGGDCGGGGGID